MGGPLATQAMGSVIRARLAEVDLTDDRAGAGEAPGRAFTSVRQFLAALAP